MCPSAMDCICEMMALQKVDFPAPAGPKTIHPTLDIGQNRGVEEVVGFVVWMRSCAG